MNLNKLDILFTFLPKQFSLPLGNKLLFGEPSDSLWETLGYNLNKQRITFHTNSFDVVDCE